MSVLTVQELADAFGIPGWKIRRLIRRGFLAAPPQVAGAFLFLEADLPKIEAALRRANYLKPTVEAK